MFTFVSTNKKNMKNTFDMLTTAIETLTEIKQNLPKSKGRYVLFNGMELDVEFEIDSFFAETQHQPAEGGNVDINGYILAGGEDISYLFENHLPYMDQLREVIFEQYANE